MSLPRTTERPARECADEPRTSEVGKEAGLVRGECSELPRREVPQSRTTLPKVSSAKPPEATTWYGVYPSTCNKLWGRTPLSALKPT
jgi:hypothetical protein